MDERRRPGGPTKPADPLERVTSRDEDDAAVTKLAPAGVFGYAAGKSNIAKRLVKLFPAHKVYTEPFCGSAALFFTKAAAPIEMLNDRDPDVMFALGMVKSITKDELSALRDKDWIGNRRTFMALRKLASTERVDRLHKFLYVTNFSFSKNLQRFNPDRAGVVARAAKRVEKWQPRLAKTTLLEGDYEDALRKFDHKDAFHFIDPPYAGYSAPGRGVGEREFDETRFRKVLESLKGRFLVTYGVKGKLDTSGFEVKRMRQIRYAGNAPGVAKDKTITHLLISNFKLAEKNIGDGVALDDVVGILDTDERGERLMVTGSRTSVSVPESIGTTQATVQARFLDKRCEVDLIFQANGEPVAWTFDVQRADVVGDPRDVAKSFSPEGSRFFVPLTEGVRARPMTDSVATDVVKIDRPTVELGLQTDNLHEYFLKSDELAGVLTLERVPDVGVQYPWIATFCDRFPGGTRDFPVLKAGAPMPPRWTSALPSSLEKIVPIAMRYWTLEGAEAESARDALRASKILAPESIAIVDGEFARIDASYVVLDTPMAVSNESLVTKAWGWDAVEIFTAEAAKAMCPEALAYVDFAEGVSEPLAKALLERPGPFLAVAIDTEESRAALGALGRVFKLRPGPVFGLDVANRIFVTSEPVHAPVDWIGKAEWTTAYVNDLPDSAFLYIEPGGSKDEDGKTKPRSLRHFPYRDASGSVDVAHARNAIARIPQASIPEGLKSKLQERARNLLDDAQKAVLQTPEPPKRKQPPDPKLRLETPSDDTRDVGKGPKKDEEETYGDLYRSGDLPRLDEKKADFNNPEPSGTMTTAPGFLVPAQQGGVSRKKPRYEDKGFAFAMAKAADDDERIVTGIVLEPDTIDAQDDIYSAEEVRAAAHTYMEEFQNTGFMHRQQINAKAKVVESYLAPDNFVMAGQQVKKGTWVMAMHVLDDALWAQCKAGQLTGFSIGGSAKRTPEPTAKGMRKLDFQGIPITIDRPKGYVQQGRDEKGTPWTRTYTVDYGFIPRTKGGDGEGIDVFLGPDADASTTYWIAQKKADGSFDEYKVMLGFSSPEDAKATYLEHVPSRFLGEMFPVPIGSMKGILNKEPDHPMPE